MNQPVAFQLDELSLQQLLTFCRVYELQSYSAAARALHLSVPTAWEQLRGLQQRYGVAFFEKKGRGIETTPAGTQLYRSLQPILAGLESTFELVGLVGNSPG